MARPQPDANQLVAWQVNPMRFRGKVETTNPVHFPSPLRPDVCGPIYYFLAGGRTSQ